MKERKASELQKPVPLKFVVDVIKIERPLMGEIVAQKTPVADEKVWAAVAAQMTHAVAVKLLTLEHVAEGYVPFAARIVSSTVVYMKRGVAKEAFLVIQKTTMAG